MRLYSYWRSSASHRVRIALQLKGLDYEYVPVHLAAGGGEQYSAAYRALNPQSRVPALETSDGVLTQSMAIMEWLEETYPEPPLLPRTPGARARVRAMAQLMVADVQPLQNTSVTRYLQQQLHQDEAAVERWRRHWVARGMAVLEEMLEGDPAGDYCHGAQPTLADVCLLAQCASARRFGLDTATWPRIARIEKACNANAAFQRAAPANQPDAER
ncbi:MAG: maleylacetoacetate isomerase [Proteobacteria bacterium]|nr:maleylacetoacetate isomerase [Pseudomonadota bacterium]